MDHIDNLHQFERRQHCAPIENISSVALQSLDTVRALHQTVVSLRTALEDAHREIETLKKRIVITGDIEEGKKYREHIANDVPIETTTNINVSRIPNREQNEGSNVSEEDNDDDDDDGGDEDGDGEAAAGSTENVKEHEKHYKTRTQVTSTATRIFIDDQRIRNSEKTKIVLPAHATEQHHYSARTPRMASKIDVKIKLSSNIKLDSCNDSSSNCSDGTTTAESTSDTNTPRDGTSSGAEQEAAAENAQIGGDTKVVAPKEIAVAEGAAVATENESGDGPNDDDDDNDAAASRFPKSPQRSVSDNQEEVDDIELIFSSDDKEFPQEDLVSISYYEPWQACGQSGTPVLLNFGRIGSEDAGQPNADDSAENLSPSPIDPDRFYNAIKENVGIMAQQSSRESSDSLSFYAENNNLRGNKSPSIDQEPDDGKDGNANADEMRRDESFDTFEPTGFSSALGRRWTNYNVFIETDISKVGIVDENVLERGGRRNTCPNPPAYRPIIHREALLRHQNGNSSVTAKVAQIRCPTSVKFARNARLNSGRMPRALVVDTTAANKGDYNNSGGPKRSSSAQTDISALPEHWRSESHLAGGLLGTGFFTLPSKFVPPPNAAQYKHPLKVSEKTREARRVLLSDINFTSMVPELSRSADHLCQAEHQQTDESDAPAGTENPNNSSYYKGPMLKTPDYVQRGLTPSMSLTSPGVSQWTVNENSYGTQTTQTDNYWSIRHGDSFDSCKSYSTGSKISFGRHHRSRSCPSVRCMICKHHHHHGSGVIKLSESMHYTPRVTFQEPMQKVRGSLPDLRPDCVCGCSRYVNSAGRAAAAGRTMVSRYGDSCGSTESLIDEADDYLRKSADGPLIHDNDTLTGAGGGRTTTATRRCSENDLKKDFSPSRQTLPFLPKSSKCLKVGHLAKVIAKNGRVVIGRVRYIGPLISTQSVTMGGGGNASTADADSETFVGLQLPSKIGECDGSFEGRRIFECEPQHGIFVPFKKIVMAWTS